MVDLILQNPSGVLVGRHDAVTESVIEDGGCMWTDAMGLCFE